jgi:hypothetical protein
VVFLPKSWNPRKKLSLGVPWISLSIHLGGVKWIIISGKDFDIPRWIKRFLRICNYVEELLWFWNQKKKSLVAWFKCASTSHPSLKSASSWYQRQCNSLLPRPFIFLSSAEPLPTKIETSFVPSVTLMCSMLVISRYVYEHSFYELTMRYSIFKKIHRSRVIPSFL